MGLIIAIGIYTAIIFVGIHYYEEKLDDYKNAISDYKRALDLSKTHSNAYHYAFLQLENTRLKEEIKKLTPIQYESRDDYKA